MRIYLLTYLGSLLLALLITPVVIHIARALKIYDDIDIRKVHTSTIPRIGGIAVFLSAVIAAAVILLLNNNIIEISRSMTHRIITLLVTSIFIFLTGFIDDLYGMRSRHKLLAQIAAAMVICLSGIRIDSLNVANILNINFGWLSFPITIFWIIAITNAVNLIDGLDGLAAGISAIVCAVIAVFAFSCGQPLMVVLMLALLGSLSGFLFFNFNPARIFMGDCGSMFLGFVLASTSVMCTMKSGTIVGLALPTLALGLPIFDTIFSILRRYLGRRGIMSPDRSHLHHILLDIGLCHRHVVISMYILTALAAGLGMFMIITRDIGAVAIFLCVLLLLVLVFRVVGAVTFHGMIAGFRRKSTISYQTKQEIESFEKAELYFRKVKTFEQWWQAICFAADKMGFIKSSLPLINRDGTERMLAWEKRNKGSEEYNIVEMMLPVRDRRVGPPLQLGIGICADKSIESVGRRIALFGRLIEEYSVKSLIN